MTALFTMLAILTTLLGIRWVVAVALDAMLRDLLRDLNEALIMNHAPASAMLSYADLPRVRDMVFDLTLWTPREAVRMYVQSQLHERGFKKAAAVIDEL